MSNKSRNSDLPIIMSLKDVLAQELEDSYRRQSRLAITPSEYKDIQDEFDYLKTMAHRANNRVERIDLRRMNTSATR